VAPVKILGLTVTAEDGEGIVDKPPMRHDVILTHVVGWMRTEPNVRAAVLTGSLARDDATPDHLSDIDIEVYVGHPAPLLETADWYEQLGEVLTVEALENPVWHPTRLVYYADAKIDFMVANVSALQDAPPYQRPFHVLVDKDGAASGLTSVDGRMSEPPTPRDIEVCVNHFHAAALMCAKYIARGEPWLAKMRDWESKEQLLKMLEWDHKARHGWHYETWWLGHHINDWMDQDLRNSLDPLWAHFTASSSADALRRCVLIFSDASERVCIAMGMVPLTSQKVLRRIEEILR